MSDGFLVVSNLDGKLLDTGSEALATLAGIKGELVLCSRRTQAEVAPLAQALAPAATLVVENGGALVLPDGFLGPGVAVPAAKREGGRWVFELGTSRARLAAALTEIARETRAALRAFSSLSVLEIARRTGLPLRRAARLQKRDYEESFLLDEKLALARVRTAAAERGLRVVRSGRFHRLVGSSDTGRAVRVLVGMFAAKREQPETIGLGDTPGDLPMLQAVSRPILIPRRDGRVHPVLAAALPHAEAAPAPGPEGWNRAVLEVLAGRRLSAPAA